MRISGRFIVHYFPVKWILKHKPVTLSLSLALWMQNQIQIEWCGTNEQKFAEYKQKSFMNIANSNIESEANEALDAW